MWSPGDFKELVSSHQGWNKLRVLAGEQVLIRVDTHVKAHSEYKYIHNNIRINCTLRQSNYISSTMGIKPSLWSLERKKAGNVSSFQNQFRDAPSKSCCHRLFDHIQDFTRAHFSQNSIGWLQQQICDKLQLLLLEYQLYTAWWSPCFSRTDLLFTLSEDWWVSLTETGAHLLGWPFSTINHTAAILLH